MSALLNALCLASSLAVAAPVAVGPAPVSSGSTPTTAGLSSAVDGNTPGAGAAAPDGSSSTVPPAATAPAASPPAPAAEHPEPAQAPVVSEERYDHHGAVGVMVAVNGERRDVGGQKIVPDSGWRAGFDLGGTVNVGYSSDELMLMARVDFGGQQVESLLYGGYRSYFGHDRLKTVADLDLAVHFTPYVTGGVRVGVGVQYELSSVAGLYACLAGQLGFGQVVLFKAELVFGVQLRSFLLE